MNERAAFSDRQQAGDEPLLVEADVAARLGLSLSTVRRLRRRGEGPPAVPLGGRLIRYRWGTVQRWLNEQSPT